MNSKRSYLDSLNAGRQRRPPTPIADLGHTLDTLGARLERPAAAQDRSAFRTDDRTRIARPTPRDTYQDDLLARDMRQRIGAARHEATGSAVQDLALRIESARRQEESAAAIAKIAAELKSMREELRHQMTAGLHREFEALRGDIERAYAAAASGTQGIELSQELERLSDSIHSLAQRSDDRGVDLLRRELDEVRGAVGHLAREETVLAVDRRFDAFEERFSPEARLSGDPAVEALNTRLMEIAAAVDSLPESLSLRTLEDKVRTLAVAVDHFSRQQGDASPDSFALIEERLDEISRAIVASSLSVQSQPSQVEQFERIEARISSLARQIEELADDRPTGEVIDRINALSQRVDQMARRAEFPEQAVERLGEQIALIASKLDSGFSAPDTEQVVSGLERRFSSLTDLLEKQQGDAFSRGEMLFRDLEARLDELTQRLEQPAHDAASTNSAIMSAIDARFDELARRFGQDAGPASAAIVGLESRLDDISTRLEKSTQQVAGIDPDLIRSLEAQVAGLSAHLAKPGTALPDFEDIGPRLEQIEQSIAGSREQILESARLVAEETIRSIDGTKSESPAVAALATDLKALDALARRSDERNTRTFAAIHDTLLKIVDRLGTLETPGGEPARDTGARTLVNAADTPSLEPYGEDDPLERYEPELMDVREVNRSPAEAAAAAASAALAAGKAEIPAGMAGKKSMLGGLARKLSGKRETSPVAARADEDPAPEIPAPYGDLDEPLDPKFANRPLEPGSGAPDLNAIMKRVRDEHGQPTKSSDSDAAKSDFIAAARRAAQAAAAEAETRKKGFDNLGVASTTGLGKFFRSHRKTALMAIGGVMIALAGLQLGKAFLADGASVATTAPSAPANEMAGPATDESDTQAAVEAEDENAVATAEAAGDVRVIVPADNAVAALTPDTVSGNAAMETLPEEIEQTSTPATPIEASEVTQSEQADASPIIVPVEAGPVPLREAAESGDAKAMFEIGSRFAEGRGTDADLAESAKWYERSAEAGFAPAQYRIGNYYEKGTGVERDVLKAKTWYQLAAEQGNASAMHNLAVLYAMGADGTTDNESAGRWFMKAAELGVKDSQFNLGILSAKGVGVPQSLEESYKWFALVAKSGDKDAAAKRDEVANALRPEQLQKARATAELWKPKPVVAEANDVSVPDSWTESDAQTASVDMKQAIRNIQLILNKNGYDAGSADGVMGAKTKSAIAAFQEANGMAPTGEVSEELVRALLEKK